MGALSPGGTAVDVGSNVGVYTVAMAKRVGSNGHVYAFEPEDDNYDDLVRHLKLNGVSEQCNAFKKAVGRSVGRSEFVGKRNTESRLATARDEATGSVEVTTLDVALPDRKVDVLKVDVEGHEEHVLSGADSILGDPQRRPTTVVVELHPFAWADLGTTWDSVTAPLLDAGYVLTDASGDEPKFTGQMMWIIAEEPKH
jgi:FkbM family methyltransferase